MPDIENPCIINVSNEEERKAEPNEQGHLFFKSLTAFKDTFVLNFPQYTMKKVTTITVKTDFNNIPSSNWNDPSALKKLCG